MEKEVKELIAAEQTTRLPLDGCIAEKGQGVIFLLNSKELYNNIYLEIADDEKSLKDPEDVFKGDLNTREDIEAYYATRATV